MVDVKEVVQALIVCNACGFSAQLDGGETEDEVRDVCLQISKMHGRQRHGDVTSFKTEFHTYPAPTAPIDTDGRPERQN